MADQDRRDNTDLITLFTNGLNNMEKRLSDKIGSVEKNIEDKLQLTVKPVAAEVCKLREDVGVINKRLDEHQVKAATTKEEIVAKIAEVEKKQVLDDDTRDRSKRGKVTMWAIITGVVVILFERVLTMFRGGV